MTIYTLKMTPSEATSMWPVIFPDTFVDSYQQTLFILSISEYQNIKEDL